MAAAVIVLLLILMIFMIEIFDRSAQEREEKVVREGIAARIHEVASTILPQVMWDDAVRNLDNRFDPEWAGENLGAYLTTTGGFDGIVVIDGDNRPNFAADRKKMVSPSRFDAFQPAFASLVAAIRHAEVERGPLPAIRPSHGVLTRPIQAHAIVRLGGSSYIVVATLVAPDFGRYRPLGPRAPIVLAILPIGRQFLDSLARRFLLRSIHIHAGDNPAEADNAQVRLFDFRGDTAATIDWVPQRPGQALLNQLGPPIFAIGALLFVALILLYRRSRNMAEGLVASEIRATHMALHDALTGLPNRTLFLDRLEHALARVARHRGSVVVHCIDLDRFKEVNDGLGHLVGDELLRAAASRMARQCRASETFARLSGDEFAILQTDATASDAANLASRICASMAEPFDLGGGHVFSGCSIGIARTEDGGVDPVELFRQADLALYRAKAEERGRFCLFEPEMDASVKSRQLLEAELRTALSADELKLFYQPQVDGRGVMTGVEALIRWHHPDRGDISPGLFVPIAEQSGLIMALGAFTLRKAFEDSGRWRGLRVSINISANQIRSKEFLDDLATMVAESGVDPRQFELEITEGILLGDDPETLRKLDAIRLMGFSLVLDDFGTGFSSLSYLRKYPIDKIKIDRSFITNVGSEAESEEVVSAIIRLARALNLSVIAEGVETLTQWTWLRSVGCPDMQGFYFRPALAGADIDALWHRRSRELGAASVSDEKGQKLQQGKLPGLGGRSIVEPRAARSTIRGDQDDRRALQLIAASSAAIGTKAKATELSATP